MLERRGWREAHQVDLRKIAQVVVAGLFFVLLLILLNEGRRHFATGDAVSFTPSHLHPHTRTKDLLNSYSGSVGSAAENFLDGNNSLRYAGFEYFNFE